MVKLFWVIANSVSHLKSIARKKGDDGHLKWPKKGSVSVWTNGDKALAYIRLYIPHTVITSSREYNIITTTTNTLHMQYRNNRSATNRLGIGLMV